MPKPTKQIYTLQFLDDGLAIQYLDTAQDYRIRGRLVASHTLQLHASHPDYEEAIEQLQALAVSVLNDALEDFHDSEPHLESADEEDEDERGMGE